MNALTCSDEVFNQGHVTNKPPIDFLDFNNDDDEPDDEAIEIDTGKKEEFYDGIESPTEIRERLERKDSDEDDQ